MKIESLFSVKNKAVVVTGGSRGIGLMIAKGFVVNGARVYITSRSAKACEEAATHLNKMGPGSCKSIPADLSEFSEVQRFVEEYQKHENICHVLVNNAGAVWGAPIDNYPDSGFEKVMNLNVKRVFSMVQKMLPLLEKAGTAEDPARIINIGSVDGIRVPAMETFAYSASKAALHQMSSHLAAHLGQRHITVNSVAPGPFPSKMMKTTLESFEDVIVDHLPLKRLGRDEDMAGVTLYLASKAGAYVTGALIAVDGGSVVSAKM